MSSDDDENDTDEGPSVLGMAIMLVTAAASPFITVEIALPYFERNDLMGWFGAMLLFGMCVSCLAVAFALVAIRKLVTWWS